MPTLVWSEALALQQPEMDRTHQEFVDLLAHTEAALTAEPDLLLERFAELLQHTVEHFAREDGWMAATGFAPENCHGFQHQAVLNVMREVDRLAREEGNFAPLTRAVAELAIWFPEHARSMDAALAFHLSQVGFDPAAPQPQVARRGDVPPVTHCGSPACA